MENLGLTPVAARVYIYLLFCPGHEAAFEELVTYFSVSKSAVSNALKYLLSIHMVEAKTKGGQRKRYFTVNLEKMISLQLATTRLEMMFTMLNDIRIARKRNDGFAAELQDTANFFKLLAAEYPILLEKWKRQAKKGKGRRQ
jgi:predicted transcriptional regulator